jgi:hypothetical protein
MLRTLTRERALDAGDTRAVRAARVSRKQIEDARAVSFTFNTLADAFAFFVPGPKAFEAGAEYVVKP